LQLRAKAVDVWISGGSELRRLKKWYTTALEPKRCYLNKLLYCLFEAVIVLWIIPNAIKTKQPVPEILQHPLLNGWLSYHQS